MPEIIKEVMVIGAGFMGTGIAQTVVSSGYRLLLWGVNEAEIETSWRNINSGLAKMAQKGRLNEPLDKVLGRLRTTTALAEGAEVDLVIETVVEKLSVKEEVFRTLDVAAAEKTILASNTSTIPISKLAAATQRPQKVVGLHFSSPVPLMPVAEVIRTIATSEETFEAVVAFVQSLGKEPIRVNFDVAGFIFNRVNLPSNVEAIRLVERGVATVEDVDQAMRLAFGRPMGPFETSDMVGLDTGYYALLSMYEETKDPKFYPPDLLARKVWLGHLGRKTRRG